MRYLHKLQIVWKIYFWAYALFTVVATIAVFFTKSSKSVDYIDAIFSLPSIVALYGWAWQKQILKRTVWLAYVPIFIVFDILFNVLAHGFDSNQRIGLIIVLPSYIAMLLYANKWDRLSRKSHLQ